jgi:hypothetical protein
MLQELGPNRGPSSAGRGAAQKNQEIAIDIVRMNRNNIASVHVCILPTCAQRLASAGGPWKAKRHCELSSQSETELELPSAGTVYIQPSTHTAKRSSSRLCRVVLEFELFGWGMLQQAHSCLNPCVPESRTRLTL